MRKKAIRFFISIVTCFVCIFVFVNNSYAIDIVSPISIENVGELINKSSGVVTPLSVVGFIFTIIYAGFTRMTAAGNAEKEAKSMKIAISAAIGFAIMALAPLIVRVITNLLGVEDEVVT